MSRIEVFFAYQFASNVISRTDREMHVTRAIQSLDHQLMHSDEPHSVSWLACDLQSAQVVLDQIFENIKRCAVFVADISEVNPNVMFELGMAFAFARGENKPISIICHKQVAIDELPSDIRGLYIETYEKQYFSQIFAGQLDRCVRAHIAQLDLSHDLLFGRREMFMFERHTTLDIVCSELPDSDLPYFAKPEDHNYLRYARFADLDSFIHVKSHILRIYPDLRIRDFTASEHKSADYDALVVLGGPAWNQRFRVFQDQLPFAFIERADTEDDLFQFKPNYGVDTSPLGPTCGIGGKIAKDISVVCRLTDVSGRRIFLFAGCLTFGVLGACKALLCRGVGSRNATYIEELVSIDDFVLVFQSDYLEHEVIAPLFRETPPIALFRRRARSSGIFARVPSDHRNVADL